MTDEQFLSEYTVTVTIDVSAVSKAQAIEGVRRRFTATDRVTAVRVRARTERCDFKGPGRCGLDALGHLPGCERAKRSP